MIEVYDLETIKGIFTYSGFNINTKKVSQFIIHKNKNQLKELVFHIINLKGMIGFNNIGFDYPILHYIYNNYKAWEDLSNEEVITLIYDYAQEIIADQNREFGHKKIKWIPKDQYINQQLDLFKLWHFNNKARSTSLKALEIAMGMENVMEMPIDHTQEDISEEDIKSILEYNLYDVKATYEFYKRSFDKINLRNQLNKKYDLKCLNFPDSKIGEQLVLKLYCEKTFIGPEEAQFHKFELIAYIKEVKSRRTFRGKIKIKDCIFSYINFQSKEFSNLLNLLKAKTITETKGELEYSVILKGFKYDYGTGGIHGCIKSGVYESDNDYVIIDADVASLYPSIAILNNLYPKHLGEIFCKVYKEDIVDVRLKAKKEGNMVLADGFKLSANSVYGKSNDKDSFLYDPKYTMDTTINGQLLLSMLAESLVLGISDLTMLQINTDGLTVKMHKSHLDDYYWICKEWEKLTKLTLEYAHYSKMIIRDVNNYIAVTLDKKIKYKGAFEIDKDYHKNHSFKIIPIALSKFFVDGIPVEETIKNHKVILDFCGRQKFGRDSYGQTIELKYDNLGNPYSHKEKQQKNVRYYISNKGVSFVKKYSKGSSEVINKGFQVTIFNKVINKEFNEYFVDYQFYIKECYKEINIIMSKQTTLF